MPVPTPFLRTAAEPISAAYRAKYNMGYQGFAAFVFCCLRDYIGLPILDFEHRFWTQVNEVAQNVYLLPLRRKILNAPMESSLEKNPKGNILPYHKKMVCCTCVFLDNFSPVTTIVSLNSRFSD